MRWKVYYGDGSTFSNQDGTPFTAPARDVQVIVLADKDHGWRMQAEDHYYVWDDRGGGFRWWGVDHFGLYDYLIEPGTKRVLFGRRLESPEYNEIFKRASEDPDFPRKTSLSHQERKP